MKDLQKTDAFLISKRFLSGKSYTVLDHKRHSRTKVANMSSPSGNGAKDGIKSHPHRPHHKHTPTGIWNYRRVICDISK